MIRPAIARSPLPDKKKGASGITTLAPYVAGQWGRGGITGC